MLHEFDNKFFNQGYRFIAGIDEAGRGPLAGPVVASAVILPPNISINGVDDSKKLTPEKREILFEIIKEKALSIGTGIVSSKVIDEINILEATKVAMLKAVENLTIIPNLIIIDGITPLSLTHQVEIKQITIKKGDTLSQSIASASIIAKVTRDRLMLDYDAKYPKYLFAKHKGYGTAEHLERIKEFGPCEIHRNSFKGVYG
ncbi:MAG: ribonuclease HII [Nitrospinae bacterium RIFCSPLOWO2_12_39_16]|nr:MAG: ribonuclease HII [Nitrospinae bacterium RIFCSPLOWO2_12_39_16]